ncbi:hypothetical protein [uncultured Brevibacterium sp.]|uniref:hypothetical protein n=1 Tax=uncultured Brevibacterium sp. TaxID=189678 RepID=UPI0025CD946D|nr:hypothetical protein [uncultured Brevibacterium sp.]
MWILLGIIAALAVLAVAVAGSMGLFDSPMTQSPDQLSELDETEDNPRFAPAMFGYSRNDVDAYVTRLQDRIRDLEGESGVVGESSTSVNPGSRRKVPPRCHRVPAQRPPA